VVKNTSEKTVPTPIAIVGIPGGVWKSGTTDSRSWSRKARSRRTRCSAATWCSTGGSCPPARRRRSR
jgi:hypothetical protein